MVRQPSRAAPAALARLWFCVGHPTQACSRHAAPRPTSLQKLRNCCMQPQLAADARMSPATTLARRVMAVLNGNAVGGLFTPLVFVVKWAGSVAALGASLCLVSRREAPVWAQAASLPCPQLPGLGTDEARGRRVMAPSARRPPRMLCLLCVPSPPLVLWLWPPCRALRRQWCTWALAWPPWPVGPTSVSCGWLLQFVFAAAYDALLPLVSGTCASGVSPAQIRRAAGQTCLLGSPLFPRPARTPRRPVGNAGPPALAAPPAGGLGQGRGAAGRWCHPCVRGGRVAAREPRGEGGGQRGRGGRHRRGLWWVSRAVWPSLCPPGAWQRVLAVSTRHVSTGWGTVLPRLMRDMHALAEQRRVPYAACIPDGTRGQLGRNAGLPRLAPRLHPLLRGLQARPLAACCSRSKRRVQCGAGASRGAASSPAQSRWSRTRRCVGHRAGQRRQPSRQRRRAGSQRQLSRQRRRRRLPAPGILCCLH